ncbi:MAG: hypothetical protein GX359_07890 [Clostridiales bacterium]|nr:hypothetical protein [Clostridiales bacterium]
MNEDTIKLLKEVNSGCKSGTNSMEQVMPIVKDEQLKAIIKKYNDIHIKLGDECHALLNKVDKDEKDPSAMAKAMSWISTEMKLMINDDANRVAELMVDGCNMGIKSLSQYINKYKAATPESIDLARRLVRIEQDFMNELLPYL